MPAEESTEERRSRPLPTILFWAGVGLAPLAALLLLVADGNGLLRIAAVLAILAVVLIGLSITVRGDVESVRLAMEESLLEEVDELRADLRRDIETAARATHRAFGEKLQVLQDELRAVRAQAPAGPPTDQAGFRPDAAGGSARSATGSGPPAAGSARVAAGSAQVAAGPAAGSARVTAGSARVAAGSARVAAGSARVAAGSARVATGFAQPAAGGVDLGPRRHLATGVVQHTETVKVTTRQTIVGAMPDGGRDGGYGAGNEHDRGRGYANVTPSGAGAYAAGPDDMMSGGPYGSGAPEAEAYHPSGPEVGRHGARRPDGGRHRGGGPDDAWSDGSWSDDAWPEGAGREDQWRGGGRDGDGWHGGGRDGDGWEGDRRNGDGRRGDRWHSAAYGGAAADSDRPGPGDAGSWSDVRAGDRWASVRSDGWGHQVRMGERHAAMRADDSGSELHVADRWSSVRRHEPPGDRYDWPAEAPGRHDGRAEPESGRGGWAEPADGRGGWVEPADGRGGWAEPERGHGAPGEPAASSYGGWTEPAGGRLTAGSGDEPGRAARHGRQIGWSPSAAEGDGRGWQPDQSFWREPAREPAAPGRRHRDDRESFGGAGGDEWFGYPPADEVPRAGAARSVDLHAAEARWR